MLEQCATPRLAEALQLLVELGRKRGHVDLRDLIEHLPAVEDDPELLEVAASHLESMDIEVRTDSPPTLERSAPEGCEATDSTDLAAIDSDDSVSLYFREVGSVPLLTREEEVALAQRIERGRQAERALRRSDLPAPERKQLEGERSDGQAAWEHLIRANSRLVISLAKKYRGQGVPFLDLIQEGNVGLMKAADKFDYRRGYKFSTYATWWIRQAVTRALANQGRTIRVPVHLSDRIRKLFAIAQALEQDLGRRPTPAELAERMALPEDKVEQMLRVATRNLSLEKPVGDDQDSELGHFIEDVLAPDPLEDAARKLLQKDIDDMLQCLTAREALILRLRYGLGSCRPHTLKEVGRKFNLTRERIRQIEQEALHKLRQPDRRKRLSHYLH